MKVNEIMISIVVPVYNVPENYLRKCIESLIDQTLLNIEIILVDDGCPSQGGFICDTYAEMDSRIKVIHQENKGLSGARNTGLYASSGQYITFVDGDDWIDSDMCEALSNAAESGRYDVVFCSQVKEYTHTSVPSQIKYNDHQTFNREGCKYLQEKVFDFYSKISTTHGKIINRQLLLSHNIDFDADLRQGAEGHDFNLRLFGVAESALFIARHYYHYTYNEHSISANTSEKNNEYVLSCYVKMKKYVENSDNKDNLLAGLYNRMIHVVLTTAVSGYFNPANTASYQDKVIGYKKFLSHPLIKESMKKASLNSVNTTKRITLFFVKHRCFLLVSFIARLRKKQLQMR